MFNGDFSGWSSGLCKDITTGYWGTELIEVNYTLFRRDISTIVPSPFFDAGLDLNGAVIDPGNGYPVAYPESDKKYWHAKPVSSILWPDRSKTTRFPIEVYETPDFGWSARIQSDPYPNYIGGGDGPSSQGIPDLDIIFHGSWGSFINGTQKYIAYVHRRNKPQDEGFPNIFRARTIAAEEEYGNGLMELTVIDIETQTVVAETQFIMNYGYTFSDDEYIPDHTNTNFTAYPRRNLYISKDYVIQTEYDLFPNNRDTWAVAKANISGGGNNSYSDRTGFTAAGFSNDKYSVCLPAYHSYKDSDLDTNEPYVIAVRKDTSTWMESVWTNNETVGGSDPDGDPTGYAYLSDDDVTNGTVLTSGQMSSNARVLCYNRVNGRTMAIFFDQLPKQNITNSPSRDDICPGYEDVVANGDQVFVTYFNTYLYDSESTPQLQLHTSFKICTTDAAGSNPPVYCEGGLEEDGGQNLSALIEGEKPGDPTKFGIGTPGFITCDDAGDLYIGSPTFIKKLGPELIPSTGKPQWEYYAEDFYKKFVVQVNNGCTNYSTIFQEVPLPFSASYGGKDGRSYQFGKLDYRDFAILPTSEGIQLRGFQGMIDFASPKIEPLVGEFVENSCPEGRFIEFYAPAFAANVYAPQQWIMDWSISRDGQTRVPHIEPVPVFANMLFTERLISYDDFHPDFNDSNGDFRFFPLWQVIDHPSITSEPFYWKPEYMDQDIYNEIFILQPKCYYTRHPYYINSYGIVPSQAFSTTDGARRLMWCSQNGIPPHRSETHGQTIDLREYSYLRWGQADWDAGFGLVYDEFTTAVSAQEYFVSVNDFGNTYGMELSTFLAQKNPANFNPGVGQNPVFLAIRTPMSPFVEAIYDKTITD